MEVRDIVKPFLYKVGGVTYTTKTYWYSLFYQGVFVYKVVVVWPTQPKPTCTPCATKEWLQLELF